MKNILTYRIITDSVSMMGYDVYDFQEVIKDVARHYNNFYKNLLIVKEQSTKASIKIMFGNTHNQKYILRAGSNYYTIVLNHNLDWQTSPNKFVCWFESLFVKKESIKNVISEAFAQIISFYEM